MRWYGSTARYAIPMRPGNGGLSLEHNDAAQDNPALAATLLTELRIGAMGAAGLGVPDSAAHERVEP
jgi:hypothetical protein